jgi:hypothetical protein
MKDYQISNKRDTRPLAEFLAANGQMLMPMVELVETAQLALDDLLEHLGRATLEAVLSISATAVAGASHQGKPSGEVIRHGRQQGVVPLANRKVRVDRPRLRRKAGGDGAEVEIPAYSAMRRDNRLPEKVMLSNACTAPPLFSRQPQIFGNRPSRERLRSHKLEFQLVGPLPLLRPEDRMGSAMFQCLQFKSGL